jgi:hypothetical protein
LKHNVLQAELKEENTYGMLAGALWLSVYLRLTWYLAHNSNNLFWATFAVARVHDDIERTDMPHRSGGAPNHDLLREIDEQHRRQRKKPKCGSA